MIVEDEPNIAESLKFILQRADFDVEIVADGAEALNAIRQQSFAVVILDIMLPGMNGFDILRALRSDRHFAELPVVILSAKGQANDRKTAEAIGASAFITKPFSNSEVVGCVKQLAGAGNDPT